MNMLKIMIQILFKIYDKYYKKKEEGEIYFLSAEEFSRQLKAFNESNNQNDDDSEDRKDESDV